MSQNTAKWSKRAAWRLEAITHTLVSSIMRRLPPETVFTIGAFLGKCLWPLMRTRSKTIIRNLRIVTNHHGPQTAKLARRSFINSAANLISSASAPAMDAETLAAAIHIENPEALTAAHSKGTGVILLLSHMGNWELLTRLNHLFPPGTKSGAFYRPLNNPILNKRILNERETDGTRLFSKRDSLHHVSGFLRENGIIGILADQRVGRQGELVPFFGRLTRASPLPSLLARRCGCQVLALSLRTIAPGKWLARYHPVEQPYHSTHCMKALETAMRLSLTDVFWLQERWKIYLGHSISPRKWLNDPDARGEKPHRALIWINHGEILTEIPENCRHGDIQYELAISPNSSPPANFSGIIHHPDQAHESSLLRIDTASPLPLDFILALSPNPGLQAAAKHLSIPIFLPNQLGET